MNYVAGDLRDQLAHVGHAVVQAGLVVGSGGNLSVRIPDTGECWVTAAGTWLDRLGRPDFVRVRIVDGVTTDGPPPDTLRASPTELDGSASPPHQTLRASPTELDGSASPPHQTLRASPTTELGLHLATYRARPDVNAVVHLHPQMVLLLDAIGEPIRLVTTDHAFYVRRVETVPFHPPGSAALGKVAAAACADGADCLVLAGHGCSVVADTVELAHKRAFYLEEAARFTYRALAVGRTPTPCATDWLDRDGATA